MYHSVNYKKIAISVFALFVLIVSCKLMLKGVGISYSERNIFLFAILIIILDSSKKSFYYIALPLCILHALYAPIGFIFGHPGYSYVASIFATNIVEIKEFFNAIPIINYIYSLSIIIGVLLYRYLTSKFHIKFYRNKTLLTVFIIFAMLKQAPFTYINNFFIAYKEVKNELTKLNELAIDNKWGESTLKNSVYDTYVLIIGESARKDYHHAFGYPIKNTPFMSNAKGMLVDGLTSGGPNTITSLRLTLTKSDKKWQPNYGLNFIDLAKQAGIETYWLSNQGYIGEFDTPISVIAKRSSHVYFTKYGSYDAKNTSDFLLLDHIQRIVNQNEKKKKLIVVNLLGSHPDSCERVVDYKKIINRTNKTYSYINCYISSIKKTDEFIKNNL